MTATLEPVDAETNWQTNLRERAELEGLGERIVEGAGHLAAATGTWLGMVAEFDRRGGWAGTGIVSCAHWLTWRCGIGAGTAREHVRVARALEGLPLLAAELAAGRLSYSKVRAVTRVANSANEVDLVNLALCSTGAQLESVVRGLRKAKDLADVQDRHVRRSVSWHWAEDGMLVLKARLSPEDGALLLAALEAAHPDVPAETSDLLADESAACEVVCTPANRNADSLVTLARTCLGELRTAEPHNAPNYTVNLHVDLEKLLTDDPHSRIENGPAIHPETLRRILCDSAAVVVAHHGSGGGGTSMDIGHRSRTVPRRLRRALMLRDKGCGAPGCSATRHLHAHHVVHWSKGGPTALWNLILLCSAHHHLVHEGNVSVTADGHGGFEFYAPDDTRLERVPTVHGGNASTLRALHGATIDSRTATPAWSGEKLDLHYAVNVLLLAEEAVSRGLQNVPAGTPELPEGWSLN
ncbi:MAG: DUF222 domain-containing protein [Sporichthyaceae bacterium]